MATRTYEQTAQDWNLWIQYVDPNGEMSREEFDAASIEEKIALQVTAFGPDPSEAARTLGRKGGAAKSERKAASSRANGAKGGRPARPISDVEFRELSFRRDNTEGYTDAELDALNAELRTRLEGQPSRHWDDIAKAFSDEVAGR